MELNIEKFNPSIAELSRLKEEASRITVDSPLPVVVEMRKKLVSTRRDIEGYGKGLRDEANKFAKVVIAKEKELTGIIEPEELRLKDIEAEVERRAILEARRQALPVRRAALAQIGDGIACSDEQLLEMDDTAFVVYKAERITSWQEVLAARLAEEQRKLEEEKARIAHEKEIEEAKARAVAEAEERAKREAEELVLAAKKAQTEAELRAKEAIERAAREKKEAEERAKREAEERAAAELRAKEEADRKLREEQERQVREKREAEERAERERVAAEKKAHEERERLEKMGKYRAFRAGHGWTEDTKEDYREENNGAEIVLWKRVGTFSL